MGHNIIKNIVLTLELDACRLKRGGHRQNCANQVHLNKVVCFLK